MTRWLFIGSVYPPSWEERFGVGSSPTIDVQRSLLAALIEQGWRPDAILTTPPVKRFPKDRLQRFPDDLPEEWELTPGIPLVPLGWNNLEPLKTISIAGHLKGYLTTWCRRVRSAGDSPKVLVYNLGPTHEQGGFLAGICRSLSLPVIPIVTDLDAHSGGRWSPGYWRFRWQVRLLRAADKLVALNPKVLEDFGSGKEILHLPGVVPDKAYFNSLLELPINRPSDSRTTFLYSGSLNRPRGIIRLLEAFERLSKERASLRITGRGPDENRVRNIAAEHPNIEFLGFLRTDEERRKVIEEADVLVNPHEISTPEARYLFPSKLAEYLASGRLVVSSRMPGMTGFPLEHMVLEEEDSVESLVGAMESAIRMSREERERRAKEARAWAREAFDWGIVSGKIRDFIR